MTRDKDGVDELCVGLLMNKVKHKDNLGPPNTSYYISKEEVERRRVRLTKVFAEDNDSDSNDEDSSRENQFLQLIKACKSEIDHLKREVHDLKIEVAHLSAKRKKD